MRKLILSAAAAAILAALVVVQVARCDLLWPVDNISATQPIDPKATELQGIATADSATFIQLQASTDSVTWKTVGADTASADSAAFIRVPNAAGSGWTRLVARPLNSVSSYASTGVYDCNLFLGQVGRRYSVLVERGTALAHPDPAMTTATNLHTFTVWLHTSPTESVSVALPVVCPYIEGEWVPTTATAIDNTDIGPADSSGVNWFRARVAGHGPTGVFESATPDSAVVTQGDLLNLEIGWDSRGAVGTFVYEMSVTPPDGWTVIVGADHEEVPCASGTGGGSTVAQYRAPAALSDPIAYLGCFAAPRWVGDAPPGDGEDCSDIRWGNAATYGSGSALAFRPGGDPGGDDDGFPGSLFLTLRESSGESMCQWATGGKVGEINIAVPIRTFNKDSVNVAGTIQGGGQPQGSFWTSRPFGSYQRQGGLFYLAEQGDQTTPKLYQSMYDYYTNNTDRASHTWAEVDLSVASTPAGPWHIGTTSLSEDVTSLWHYRKNCAYTFAIPDSFRTAYLDDDYRMAAGFSSREAGTQGSNQGPSATAFGPWTMGNPPDSGDIPGQLLLVYPRPTSTATCAAGVTSEANYNGEDRWTGAFWPSKHVAIGADTLAVVGFVGSRCRYECYYFKAVDGSCGGYPGSCCQSGGCPAAPNGTHCCSQRLCSEESCPGYICGDVSDAAPSRKPTILFYDEADIAQVASGTMDPWDPQPIAEVDISGFLVPECSFGPAGVAWDDSTGFLYVAQNGVWKSGAGIPRVAIHVFRVNLVSGT